MGKELTTVFLTYQTLGGYFKDPESIKTDISNQDATVEKLQQLLQDVFDETSAYSAVKAFDLDAVQKKIDAGYDECVTARQNLEATQAAEVIAKTAASAAEVALAALEWTFFGAIGAGIAAVAAEAAAAGLDVEVSNLEDTVVQKIADMAVDVKKTPGLDDLNAYQAASDKVTLGLPIWELSGNKTIIRHALQGLAHTSKSADEMRTKLIDIYDTFNEPGDILGKYILFGEAIIKGDEKAVEEATKSLKEALCQGASDAVAKASKGVEIAAGLTIASGLVGKVVAKRMAENLGKVFSEEGLESGVYASIEGIEEVVTMSERAEMMGYAVKGVAAIAAGLDIALEVLKICSYREVVDKLNDAMDEQKKNLSNYYTELHKSLSPGDDLVGEATGVSVV